MDEIATQPGRRIRLVARSRKADADEQQAVSFADPESAGTVTVLFTDIEGSTRLVRKYGELYGTILAECQHLQRHAFEAVGGREIDTQGDSFFVMFRTSKDAVAAAVAAQQALAAHPWPPGARVRVRMGIHTTEPTAWTGRFIGLGIHRAARLCSAGHGGQVLLSETTHSLVEDGLAAGFDVRYLGEHWLKDFDRAERIWQLVVPGLADTFPPLRTPDSSMPTGPATGPSGSDGSDGSDGIEHPDGSPLGWLHTMAGTAFVGRVSELRVLREAWDRARSGHRVLALISGEPGIGKTTLAAQVARTARGDGGLVLHGRWDEEVLAPYQAYREALGEYSRTCPRPVLRAELRGHADEISRLFPEVAERIGVVGAPLPGNPEAERYRLFEALDGWLRAMASRRPVLIVLDDLQWADRSSLLLLAHLMRMPRATPLLVVATYRSTGHAELGSFLPTLTRDTECRRVQLSGLDAAQTATLLGRVTGGKLAEPGVQLARELQADTAGNPFFLTEMMRHLVDIGAFSPDSTDRPAGHLAVEIPETVRDLVRWRLGRLSPECPTALAAASVIGHEFDIDVLATAAVIDDVRLLDLLDEAVDAGLVHEACDVPARYLFAHSVVRRVLHDDLGRTRTARLHRRIADALATRPGTSPAERAHHYWACADAAVADKVIHYSRLAGERALEEAAFDSAVLHYRRALEAADRHSGEPVLRCELLLALGDAHGRAGEYPARDACFVQAATVARDARADRQFIRAAIGYGGVLPAALSPDPRARALLEETLERLGEADSAARARVLGRLAHWAHHERPYSERVAVCEQSVAMARRVDDPATLAAVLCHRCWALDGPRDVDDQLTAAAEILRLGRELGDHELLLEGLRVRMSARFRRGDFELAADTAATLADLARELRHPEFLRMATMWDVAVATLEGRYDQAQLLTDELHARLRQLGHAQTDLIGVGQAIPTRWLRGSLGEAGSLIGDIAARRSEMQVWPAMKAWVNAERGADDQVRELLRTLSPDTPSTLDENYLWWGTIVAFTRAATSVGDREWAQALYDLALPLARHNATVGLAGFLGAVTHHLGALAATLGRWDTACAHLEAALHRHQAMGSRPFVALTQVEYAGVLMSRDRDGDRERAGELREAALATAAELGLKAVETIAARTTTG